MRIELTSQTVTLIAAGIAAIASLISLILNSSLIIHRERKQQLWQFNLQRITQLEELAGHIAELFGGYPAFEKLQQEAPQLLLQLELAAGHFRRHKILNQAIRDFHNAASRAFVARRDSQDDRDDKRDLEETFARLLKACDEVIEA
ncbi:MAG: hypothetical protein AAB359_08220 [Elusimicrobiota bacterium]